MTRGKKSAQAASRKVEAAQLEVEEVWAKLRGERTQHAQVVAELRQRLQTLASDFDWQVERQVADQREAHRVKVNELHVELAKSKLETFWFLALYLDPTQMTTDNLQAIADYVGVPRDVLAAGKKIGLNRDERRRLGGIRHGPSRERKAYTKRV